MTYLVYRQLLECYSATMLCVAATQGKAESLRSTSTDTGPLSTIPILHGLLDMIRKLEVLTIAAASVYYEWYVVSLDNRVDPCACASGESDIGFELLRAYQPQPLGIRCSVLLVSVIS